MKCLEYKGYIGSIEVDVAQNFLHGKLLHIRDLVTYEGGSPEELKRAFEESVDFYLEDCAEAGEEPDKPFKGSFNVRLAPELHKDLAMCARSSGRSLNDYVGLILRNHQSYDTHRKVARAASEAAWLGLSTFSMHRTAAKLQHSDHLLIVQPHRTHSVEKKTIVQSSEERGTLEYTSFLPPAGTVQ